MSQTTSVPICLFGVDPSTAEGVVKGMEPEIEVIHFSTKPNAKEAIIALLSTPPKTPPEAHKHTSVATFDYSKQPQALVFGGGFTPEALTELRQSVAVEKGLRSVPWLGGDREKVLKAFKDFEGDKDGYAAQSSQRVNDAVRELREQGKLGVDGGLYFY